MRAFQSSVPPPVLVPSAAPRAGSRGHPEARGITDCLAILCFATTPCFSMPKCMGKSMCSCENCVKNEMSGSCEPKRGLVMHATVELQALNQHQIIATVQRAKSRKRNWGWADVFRPKVKKYEIYGHQAVYTRT